MSIRKIYFAARLGDGYALESLVVRFHPLMVKMSTKQGYFDEDCYQECAIAVILAVQKFEIRR